MDAKASSCTSPEWHECGLLLCGHRLFDEPPTVKSATSYNRPVSILFRNFQGGRSQVTELTRAGWGIDPEAYATYTLVL